MRPSLLELLCCPVCHGDLALTASALRGGRGARGYLRCAPCAVDYPIADGIPDLLPPDERA